MQLTWSTVWTPVVLATWTAFFAGPGPVTFVDVTASARIDWKHENAASSEKYLIETMAGGGGWIDYDQDGWLDLFLVNGGWTPLYRPEQAPRHALYRNLGDGTFEDVTEAAGLQGQGRIVFGMGMVAGDYDGDGLPDIYVTGYPRSLLYRNRGDGAFEDVTREAGVPNSGRWGSSAAFFDYDRNGRLDLLIVNYLDWSFETDQYCGERRPGYRQYCHPNRFEGVPPTLYKNNGDGTFTDVTQETGLARNPGKSLGVVTADYDLDGWDDVFIANDSIRNFLYKNRADGTFEDVTYPSGTGFSADGRAEAGMGTDFSDLDQDGYPEIYITHLDMELDRLYWNLRDGTFADVSEERKTGIKTIYYSGFGCRFLDYDNDGSKDIFVANGHILDNISLIRRSVTYEEPNLMFANTGSVFEEVSPLLGKDFTQPRVSRAAAVADFDNDGDLDLLVVNNGQAPNLLRNDGGNARQWIGFQLRGTRSNRDGFGAKIKIQTDSGPQYEQKRGGSSYLSSHDPRVFFGLGEETRVSEAEIQWPSGQKQVLKDLRAGKVHWITEPGAD